jgi:hypothetical protein
MTLREQVLQNALALSPEDRAFVADRLEQSLGSRGFASPEIATAWNEEVDRRISAYGRGELQAEDAEVAMRRMRQYLADHRSQLAKS